ncbi:putative membrane protein [Escherichia coli DEC14C]|nr:putative membrane protein [Escherichia coli DEC14C]
MNASIFGALAVIVFAAGRGVFPFFLLISKTPEWWMSAEC